MDTGFTATEVSRFRDTCGMACKASTYLRCFDAHGLWRRCESDNIRHPTSCWPHAIARGRRFIRKVENHMKTQAAVAFAAGKPLEVVTLDLEGPKAGEVLVELKATGICHTDEFT